jgi:hypothetical protein
VASGQYIDVPSIAQAVLIGVAAHFNDAGVELPDRQVIAPGEPRTVAWDCSAVMVTLGGIVWGQAPGAGGGARQTGNPISVGARHAVISVQIVRPAMDADGDVPDAEKLTDAGLTFIRDAALLSEALIALCRRGGALVASGSATPGDVVALGPDGGFTAVEGSLSVTAKDRA